MSELLGYIGGSYKRRLFVGCLSILIGIPVVCCMLTFLIYVVLPFMDNLARNGDGNAVGYILAGVGLVSLVVLLGIPVIIAVFTINRRTRAFDAIFTPLGLTGSMYLIYGRHYLGQIAGREVDIYIYRGPTVEMRIKTNVPTRTLFFPHDSIPAISGVALNKRPMQALPGLENFAIFSLDEAWTRILLGNPQAVQAVRTLMTVGAGWAIFRSVEIQPGEIVLYMRRSRSMFASAIPLEAAHTWLAALETLARAAEEQPAPQVTANPAEGDVRARRQGVNKFQTCAIAFIVLIMPLCFISIGVLVFLIVTQLGN